MKKTYNIPTMKVQTFCTENIITTSGYSDPNKTIDENLNTYISDKNLVTVQNVELTWSL